MDGLRKTDELLFRWFNQDASAPWLDPAARILSGHPMFVPMLVVLGVGLIWKGGPRGLVFVAILGLAAALANEWIAEPLKDWCGRSRPYAALPDTILRVGKGNPLGSMPSAHAMNMALIATITAWYYPKTKPWIVVAAIGVGWSRVYNGVHFPGDVLVGWALGALAGWSVLAGSEIAWVAANLRWRWNWGRRVPSLLEPAARWPESNATDPRRKP